MASIRKRLLINLIALYAVSWLAAIGATYREAHHEIEELFDAALAQEAGIIAELTLEDIENKAVEGAQLTRAMYGHKYERKISFQIWRGDRLLLRSQSAPPARLSSQLGFTDEQISDNSWRVFGMHAGENRYTIYTAERYAVRDELISHITRDTLFPLLWALPLLALFIWFGIGGGLAPLKRIAGQVARRSPQQLSPVDTERVPEEIAPLTASLNDLLQRLQAAFEKERRFTSDAAHELRTPLASIKTQAQVALRAADIDERKQALRRIIQGVDRSTHLVEQMLTLARLEPDASGEEFRPVALASMAETVVAELAPVAMDNGVELSFTSACPDEHGCQVKGYAPGLTVLLSNLVDNAIRHTPQGGQVEVSLLSQDECYMLAVSDTGPGIPEHERLRVFDRFYRPPGQDSYGCGLGLAIVQRIAQLHQAEVEIHDRPAGSGTQVTVRFKKLEISAPGESSELPGSRQLSSSAVADGSTARSRGRPGRLQ